MKKTLQLLNYVIVLFTAITSCNKDHGNYVFPPPPAVIDTLPGKEFSFSDLPWVYYYSGASSSGWDEIYLATPPRPDLFGNPGGSLKIEVFLKFDTAADWNEVKPNIQNNSLPIRYSYYINNLYQLVINLWPLYFQLVGKKASIKVKFL